MIVGRDVMHSLGINLLFDTAEISWDNAKVHMQSPEVLRGDWIETLEQELLVTHDSVTMDEERIQDIDKSNIAQQILTKIVEEGTHLEHVEQKQLLSLLQKIEDLFDGSLGTWNTDPIQLELNDPNCTMLNHIQYHILKRKR